MSDWLDLAALSCARRMIDRIDDGVVGLFVHRQRLAGFAGRIKSHAGLHRHDPEREQAVLDRARRLARRRGLDEDSVVPLMTVLIAQAHRQQRQSRSFRATPTGIPMSTSTPPRSASALLRWVPPPRYWRRALRVVPLGMRDAAALRLLARAIASPEAQRNLRPVEGRRIGIEVQDLGLRWVVELHGEALRFGDGEAEATVRGSATDLLLLASRLEDADTLFFQRRLMLTGDTELGLLLRNLLDRLPWESLPLALRIVVQRGARIADQARAAYHASREHAA